MLVLRLPKVVLFGVGKSRSLLWDREAGEGWSPATRPFPSAAAGGCGLAACLLLLPRESALSMAGFAAPEKEEGAFRGGDGAWLLQSKQGQWKKHGSFLEVCSSTPPIIVGGVIFQLFKSFERSASLFEYDLKEMMPS